MRGSKSVRVKLHIYTLHIHTHTHTHPRPAPQTEESVLASCVALQKAVAAAVCRSEGADLATTLLEPCPPPADLPVV